MVLASKMEGDGELWKSEDKAHYSKIHCNGNVFEIRVPEGPQIIMPHVPKT